MRIVILVGLLGACAGEETDPLCEREVPLTYDNWGQGFLDTHCNGCHSSIIAPRQRRGAPDTVNFDTYDGVLTFAERIDDRVILAKAEDRSAMPPGGGPTAEELAMLHEWLECTVYDDKIEWEGQ